MWGLLRSVSRATAVERVLCSVVPKTSSRMLASSNLHGAHKPVSDRVQFPRLPPEWEEKYKPGQMYRHQASLPQLPIPSLQQTLQKYITSVEPLLSPQELEETTAIVKEFGRKGGAGEKLQQALLEKTISNESWLPGWCSHEDYMRNRRPLVVHSNPAVAYPRQPAGDVDTYIRTAAMLLLTFVKWTQLVLTASVPPDFFRSRPLCMSQFDMYSRCRIPGRSADTARKTAINDSRHIIVVRNGHFFKLDVLYEVPGGCLAPAPGSHIVEELHRILRAVPTPAEHPVGILTTEHRDTWYQARERLRKDSLNRSSLDVIERAQFILCLDQGHPSTSSLPPHFPFSDIHSTVLANRCLHGGGSEFSSGNRWFDSGIQVLVGEDGGCGNCVEHSVVDGTAVFASFIFTLDLISKLNYDLLGEPSAVDPTLLHPAEQLQWNISSESARDIDIAKKNLDNLVIDTDLEAFIFTDFGKRFMKSVNLSPDGFLQLAFQLAYYKLFNRPVATCESAFLRQFKYGRIELIRCCTNASLAFMRVMSDPKASVEEKADSIVHAVKAHIESTNDAISGQAVDRHLNGLKLIAAEAGMETPALFKDVAYTRSVTYILFTSNNIALMFAGGHYNLDRIFPIPVAQHKIFQGYGRMVEEGYGVGFIPQDDQILFGISSFRHAQHPDTSTKQYIQKLRDSMTEMHDIMVATGGHTSKL